MADRAAPLSRADQVLANVLGWLVAHPVQDRPTEDMMLSVLREILPGVNRQHPMIGPLATAADAYLSFFLGADGRTGMWQSRVIAGPAVANFLKWRAAMALDALRAEALAE